MSRLESQVHRMRQRLARIEQQVRSTRLEFADGITVSNSTGRSLNLTLNISQRQKYPNQVEEQREELTLNSNFKLPNNSVVTHNIKRNAKDYFNSDYSSSYLQSSKSRQIYPSPTRSHQREEQKFRSTGSWKKLGDTLGENIKESLEKKSTNNQIKIEEQDCSDIEQQSKARPITHQCFEKKASNQHKQETKYQTLPNESHINKSTYTQSSTKTEPIEQSPQVYSYLHQEYRNQHPEINTSFKRSTQINTQYQENIDTPIKNKSKQPINSHSNKLSNMRATSNRVSANKMFETQHIQSVNHGKGGSTSKMQNWSVMASQHSKSNSKYELQNRDKPKAKAEQLYKQRKQKIPAKTFAKDESRHRKDVNRRFNRFVTATRAANQHSLSKHSLSPKIEAITDRLTSRQKSPCGHYRTFSESKQRESFNRLIDQNPVASKYICKQQRQQLFQLLRNDSESVSLWPMKIVNYTYSKLKKSCSVNYSILEV